MFSKTLLIIIIFDHKFSLFDCKLRLQKITNFKEFVFFGNKFIEGFFGHKCIDDSIF
jgi:hypothetical protein